jgi:hypothetical protein
MSAAAAIRLPPAIAELVGEAFGSTFWWIIGLSVVATVTSLSLPRHAQATADEQSGSAPLPVAR